jgi:two-component system phosphate regulon sensor histidine kinase PhoR
MRKRRLLWQFYPSHLLIIILSLVAVTWFCSTTLRSFHLQQAAATLETKTALLKSQVTVLLINQEQTGLIDLCRNAGREGKIRITVIDTSGRVIADSDEDQSLMDNHADRPEVRAALVGNAASSVRFSSTLQHNMMYFGLPLTKEDGNIIGVLRTAIPLTSIDKHLTDIYLKSIMGALVIAILAALISLINTRRISRPLGKMRLGAQRFARGDFRQKLSLTGSEAASLEVSELVDSMNLMAEQLDDRIKTVIRHRSELETVFAAMKEAVIVVDTRKRFQSLNTAAAKLLSVTSGEVIGKDFFAIVDNAVLQNFVKKTLASNIPLEEELILNVNGRSQRHLLAHGDLLRDMKGNCMGAMIVLNDLTHIRKLENIRRDFVANVSHELKTPITSIKGFVETLLNGAMEDPDETRHFLEIVLRQADRLHAIVDDLLTLSRIEQEEENSEISLETLPIQDTLDAAVQTCTIKAAEKDITVRLNCPPELAAAINPPLFEQAVINLIVNGIKYSNTGSEVKVDATDGENGIIITVQDTGVGIEAEHLPRLFERFYRSDKARSRKLGGTGLGLAIVKHIVQAHNGSIQVSSSPGQGSTFTIHLPKPEFTN